MHGWKENFDEQWWDDDFDWDAPDDREEVWRELAQLSDDEQKAVEEFNAAFADDFDTFPKLEFPPDELPF